MTVELPAQEGGREDLARWRSEAFGGGLEGDEFFVRLLRRHLGDGFDEMRPHLRRVADLAGSRLAGLVDECGRDEHLPVLRCHDPLGRATEEVVFHPAYHEAGRIFWGSGVLAELAEPGHEVRSGALAYLLDHHGESGHLCPLACTAGLTKLVQRVGTDEQKKKYLPGLLERDYDKRIHASQFLTEVQGGSDVGLNAVEARKEADGWRLHGEKWFCSVIDAQLFLLTARPVGAPPGTRGLGLFIVPRNSTARSTASRCAGSSASSAPAPWPAAKRTSTAPGPIPSASSTGASRTWSPSCSTLRACTTPCVAPAASPGPTAKPPASLGIGAPSANPSSGSR